MVSVPVLLFVYCVLIALCSLVGGWLPLVIRLTHTRMQLALSFVAGAMLVVGLALLLPHACDHLGSVRPAVAWALAGFLAMFLIERVFHFHHHATPDDDASACDHAHAPGHHHAPPHDPSLPKRWQAALAGLALHSVLDGVALASVVMHAADDPTATGLAGLLVFLAIALHKPFDSLTLGALMAAHQQTTRRRQAINALYALSVPAGVLLFWLVLDESSAASTETIVGAALAFAAGTFLCISTSDLLPELQFHSHDRLKLTAALLLGLILSYGLVAIEEASHEHGPREHGPASGGATDHDHHHDAGHGH